MGLIGLVRLGVVCSAIAVLGAAPAQAATAASVTVASNFQSELGCPDDWSPDCGLTDLAYDGEDGVWQRTFFLPAGDWEYKAAVDASWDENYGVDGIRNGPVVPLAMPVPGLVRFYFDHATPWLADSVNDVIAVAVGDFQSELGCASDWDPACLRSWLQDPDGDGVLRSSVQLPPGQYEAKVAHDESWNENYGAGGIPNGANIPFTVPRQGPVAFAYDAASHVLTIAAQTGPPVVEDLRLRTAEDTPLEFELDASDPDGGVLTVTPSGPAHGTVTCNGLTCTYAPAPDFHGADAFELTVTDPQGDHARAAVDVDVTPVNDAPVAREVTLVAPQGTSSSVELDAGDVDGDVLTFAVADGPSHGEIVCTGARCSYRPDDGFAGSDLVTYTATDPAGAVATAVVRITVPREATRLVAHPLVGLEPLALRQPHSATLTRARDGAAVAGRRITFTTMDGRPACSATTDAAGRATCSPPAALLPTTLGGGYRARFAGDAQHLPSSATAPLVR